MDLKRGSILAFTTVLYCHGFVCAKTVCLFGTASAIICNSQDIDDVGHTIVHSLLYGYDLNPSKESCFNGSNNCTMSIDSRENSGIEEDPVYRHCSGKEKCDLIGVNWNKTLGMGCNQNATYVGVKYDCIPDQGILSMGRNTSRNNTTSIYLASFRSDGHTRPDSTCVIQGEEMILTAIDVYIQEFDDNCGEDEYKMNVWSSVGTEALARFEFRKEFQPHYNNIVIKRNVTEIWLLHVVNKKEHSNCIPINVWWKIESDFPFNVSCYGAHLQVPVDKTATGTPVSNTMLTPTNSTTAPGPDVNTSTTSTTEPETDANVSFTHQMETTSHSPNATPRRRFPVALVAGVAGGGGVLLLVLICVVLLCYRRSKRSSKAGVNNQSTTDPSYDNPVNVAYDECFPESSDHMEKQIAVLIKNTKQNGESNGHIELNAYNNVKSPHNSHTYHITDPGYQNTNSRVAFDNTTIMKTPTDSGRNFYETPDSAQYDSVTDITQQAGQQTVLTESNACGETSDIGKVYDKIKLQTTKQTRSNSATQDDHYNVLYGTTDETQEQGHIPNGHSGYDLATFIPDDNTRSKLLISDSEAINKLKPTVPQKPKNLSKKSDNTDKECPNEADKSKVNQSSLSPHAPNGMELIDNDVYEGFDAETNSQNTIPKGSPGHNDPTATNSTVNSSPNRVEHRSIPVSNGMELIENDMYAGFDADADSQNAIAKGSAGPVDPTPIDSTTNSSHDKAEPSSYPVPDDMELIENDMYAGFDARTNSQNTISNSSPGHDELTPSSTADSLHKGGHGSHHVPNDMPLIDDDLYAEIDTETNVQNTTPKGSSGYHDQVHSSQDTEEHKSHPVPYDMELIENDMYAGFAEQSQNTTPKGSGQDYLAPHDTGNSSHKYSPVPNDMELIDNDMYSGVASERGTHESTSLDTQGAGNPHPEVDYVDNDAYFSSSSDLEMMI